MIATLRLRKDIAAHVRRGHPWVYRDALEPPRQPLAPGALIAVEYKGERLSVGYVDPEGVIAVRRLGRGDDDPEVAWRARVDDALALRVRLAAWLDTDAVRLLHGENDGVPGLVIDRYADVAVVVLDGDGPAAFWRPRLDEVIAKIAATSGPLAHVWLRRVGGRRGKGGDAGEALRGGTPAEVTIREGQARFPVDVVHGQKTGFFLDQRANRRSIAARAGGRTVLNLFAYTGGFSVAAALGGATRVTTLDLAAPAIATAREAFRRSGIDDGAHELVAADAFKWLADARAAGRTWDVVVCDPPSFAPRESARGAALGAYAELNALAAAVVAPGGLLGTASCSSHVDADGFANAVGEGVRRAGRRAHVVERAGADRDHPVDPAFPEGRYLKWLLAAL